MRDKQLAAACAVLALFGILSLVVFAKTLEPSKVGLSQIAGFEGRLVQVSGTIVSSSQRGSVTVVKICDGACADVVLFQGVRDGLAGVSLAQGSRLHVSGVVSEYKGSLEIEPLDAGAVVSG